ncbi:MAG: PQQ-like beta-propeller repeat protein [Chloroflexi bacterium]|nr:PQQ-like beta-propeller repeat protein [Chloroflexota bacterium]
MTSPATPRRILALGALALGAVALVAAGCSKPPSPQGWAAARPVKAEGQGVVLVAHKAKLYALPGQTADDLSSNALWQFPPKDKNTFPVSEQTAETLSAGIDGLDGVADAEKTRLKKMVTELNVSGSSAGTLKDALKSSGASDAQRKQLADAIDTTIKFEKGSLDRLQAFYGDIGISADNQTAFLTSFRGMVFAIDIASGQTRWIRDAGAGVIGGIAVEGYTLYFGTKGKRVYAVDAKTGDRTWQFATKGEVWATPVIDGDTIYVTSLDGSLYALDKSGKQRWVFSDAGSGIAARPAVSGDAVYVGSFDNKLYSVNKTDGTMNWSLKAGNWFWATPVVRDGIVYAASLDGKVYAVDASTGASRWERPFDTGAEVRSGPAVAGGGLIVAARNGKVFKLDLSSGQADAGSPVTAGTKILADLSTDGANTVYVVPKSATLYVVDASSQLAVGYIPLPQ